MELDEIKKVRLEKLNNLRAGGLDPYEGGFKPCDTISHALAGFQEGKEVALAGRLVANRSHGKVVFADIQDQTGKIQLFIKADAGDPKIFGIVKDLDLGDIIGVKGTLFKTKTGQESVRVSEIHVLCKSLMSLPEKWHGLKDVETRYRQRYVDLIVNKEVRDLFAKRSRIIGLSGRSWTRGGSWKSRRPCFSPWPEARGVGRLRASITLMTWTCSCASRPSSISSVCSSGVLNGCTR